MGRWPGAAALLLLALMAAPATAAELPAELPSVPPPTTISETIPLDLGEAIRLALAASPRVSQSLGRIREAVAGAEVAAAPLRFHATLRARGEHREEPGGPPRTVITDGVAQVQQPETFTYNQAQTILELRQLVFDGGRILAEVDQLKATAGEAEHQAVADLHDLAMEVRLAYLDALQAREQVAVADEALALAREHQRVAEARFQVGRAPRADLVLARAPVSQAELDATRALYRAQDAEEALSRVVGLPLGPALQLADPPVPSPLPEGLPGCLARADEKRPSLNAARLGLEAARKGVLAAQAQNNAQLSAFANVSAVGFEGASTGGYNVGLEVSWPFLDGTRAGHLAEQARARVEQAEARLREEERTVEREVRQAYREVDLAAASYRVAGVQVDRAREGLRIAEGQYRAGRTAFPSLRESALEVMRARLARTGAYYDYLRARARLDRACGDEPVPAAGR